MEKPNPGFATALLIVGSLAASAADVEPRANVPDSYALDYPAADRWCPPVRSSFVEATQTMSQVGSKRFRHQPNGGYGLPIKQKVGDKHLVHLGADLGWFQVGEPVFAVAHGIVRRSAGPDPPDKRTATKAPRQDGSPTYDARQDSRLRGNDENARPQSLMWGNVVVIEHRYADASGEEKHLTTVYGHLDTERHVQPGEIVQAGQQIGTIGRKHPNINGGYDPHLHFGVREGRLAEVGAALMQARMEGQPLMLRIVSLDKDRVVVKAAQHVAGNVQLRFAGQEFTLEGQDDGHTAPSRILWFASFPEFPIIGYDLSTDGWLDPIQTLRGFHADTNPAPYRLTTRRK